MGNFQVKMSILSYLQKSTAIEFELFLIKIGGFSYLITFGDFSPKLFENIDWLPYSEQLFLKDAPEINSKVVSISLNLIEIA